MEVIDFIKAFSPILCSVDLPLPTSLRSLVFFLQASSYFCATCILIPSSTSLKPLFLPFIVTLSSLEIFTLTTTQIHTYENEKLRFAYEIKHVVFVFLSPGYPTSYNNFHIHPFFCKFCNFASLYSWMHFQHEYVPHLRYLCIGW